MYRLKNRSLLTVALLTLMACHQTPATHESTDAAPPAHATMRVISEPCAVIYTPNHHKQEKLKQENGDESFYALANDSETCISDCQDFLQNKAFKSVTAEGGKITFRHQDGGTTIIDLDDPKYTWEVFLFDGKKVTNIDITDIESEYQKVFI
ncbi:hypothetical protein HGH92_21385 [Chitinophaga varians]|uniref:Lipoprotein n=1 Tax=Chitinophaga varians TaxID=2202339 RepID=A0A847RVH7_9BACT|nr:hypothetical protein [Chitinophaga varians]NLR66876.1 hypothetical protein [Chitinophaga varians]